MIYSVICTDNGANIHWQSELLEYSWSRVNQSGELIRLVSCEAHEDLPEHKYTKVIRTRPTSIHPDSGDGYLPYNRLFSFRQWLEEYQPQGTVLILDPDCVFRKPLNIEVQEDRPIGQHWLDFGISDSFRNAIKNASDVKTGDLQPLTWPVLIDCNDLQKIISRWIDLTAAIREKTKGWESDMFAFTVASKEHGLEFDLQTHTAWTPWPNEKVADASIIHYCQKIMSDDGQQLWWKQAYRPWDRVENTQADQEYCCDLLRLVDEHAAIRQFEETLDDGDTIFIAIAAYCEPELVSTIESCLTTARHPERLRFGICLQYDDSNPLTSSTCLDQYSQDTRVRSVNYPFQDSKGGCWARNIAQQLYDNERYTLQIDAHSQMLESWDVVLIRMMRELPSDKPLITGFPPLYYFVKGQKVFQHIDDFSQVNTAFAEKWNDDGSIHHPQKIIPENNASFPRRTRFLSGAFVFTLGQWNDEVRQDPDHFYTGEEFALTIRSFTHGYDLFDPSQIVLWHRLHPEPNRKFWHDNEDVKVRRFHNQGLQRLRWLYEGDPENRLGRYGLGTDRTLDEFHIYSGLDYKNYVMHPDVAKGIPPDPVTLTDQRDSLSIEDLQDRIVDIRIYLKGMETLELMCEESNPILKLLFQSQMDKHVDPDSVIYLNMGPNGEQVIHFKKASLVAIETDPPLSQSFFEDLSEARSDNAAVSAGAGVGGFRFSDEWKYWIWHNIFARGSSRDLVFKELILNDFPWEAIREELNHEPSIPLEHIQSMSEQERPNQDKLLIPNVKRISSRQIEIYSIDEFLMESEYGELVRQIRTRQQPSETVLGERTHEVRTSRTCFFDRNDERCKLANEVTLRISRLLGINPSYAEPLQGHIYTPNQEYKT
ncbi:UDP-N-acetylglucosamine-transferase, partial [Gammaproteobacteria bacterium]|nr:UDP-N-acetylglucosamine-transferase [Gammaproteobacteria bacterium]